MPPSKSPRFVFVTGGVMSGLGKGITTASTGRILQSMGFSVTAIKIDPYLNVDAGTLRPTEHGEVWVTDDGGEIDQDLGHYERFLDIDLGKRHNITTGQVYFSVVQKERAGAYLGKTVQIIPHITDEIKARLFEAANQNDFVLVEIGGVVGDYENIPFLEAARQLKLEGKPVVFAHVSYLPIPGYLGEAKTKPTQHSVRQLREIGIQPDFVVCRSPVPVDDVRKGKIALFCNVTARDVISNPDLKNIYELPLVFEQQGFGNRLLEKFGMKPRRANLSSLKKFINGERRATRGVKIGIVGKYFDIGTSQLSDSYISVIEAVRHAAVASNAKPKITWLDSKDPELLSKISRMDGVIIPGGFGKSGTEGKIEAIRFLRENGKPFLGLCFGLQLAVVEFARNVCGLNGANSTELEPKTRHPVIDVLPQQARLLQESRYGASMRLGALPTKIGAGTLARKVYRTETIFQRHRHRYEVNPKYIETLKEKGLVFSGFSPEGIVDTIELPKHRFFFATQYHPEFKSRPNRPEPAFLGFVKAASASRSTTKIKSP